MIVKYLVGREKVQGAGEMMLCVCDEGELPFLLLLDLV